MLGWRVTGPQITVSWGELASDWLSQLDVDSSLQDVPLSPSLSPLPFLQQQSQWDEDQREGSPAGGQRARGYGSSRPPHTPGQAAEPPRTGRAARATGTFVGTFPERHHNGQQTSPGAQQQLMPIYPGAPPSTPLPCAAQYPTWAETSENLREKPPHLT